MSKVCQITGKRPSRGNNVSHSNRKTKRTFNPNLFKKKIFNPLTGRHERVKLSTRALRTLRKQMK